MVPAASARDGGGPARRAGACNWDRQPCRQSKLSARCCLSLFHCCVSAISSAAGGGQLEICWWFQFGSGISWQQWVKATSMMAMAEEKMLAGPAAPQLEVSEVLAEHWDVKGLSFPLPVTKTVSPFYFPRKSASC